MLRLVAALKPCRGGLARRSLTQATSRITLGYCSFTNIGLIAGAGLGALHIFTKSLSLVRIIGVFFGI